VNPLHGIEVVGPTLDPLWENGQKFNLICFLSSSRKFSPLWVQNKRISDSIFVINTYFGTLK